MNITIELFIQNEDVVIIDDKGRDGIYVAIRSRRTCPDV